MSESKVNGFLVTCGKVTAVFTLIGMAVASVWALDARNEKRFAALADHLVLEERVMLIAADLRLQKLQQAYDRARDDYYTYRSLVREHPNDPELARKLEESKQDMLQLRSLLDSLLEEQQ